MEGVGLERADELEIEAARGRRKTGRGSAAFRTCGEPVLAALLGGFDRDGLPFGLFGRGVVGIEPDDGAIGKEGRDLGRADLDRFLHDEVHVFPFRDGLAEGDLATERRGAAFVQVCGG